MLTMAENLGSPEQVTCDSGTCQGLWVNTVSPTRKWFESEKSDHYPPTLAAHPGSEEELSLLKYSVLQFWLPWTLWERWGSHPQARGPVGSALGGERGRGRHRGGGWRPPRFEIDFSSWFTRRVSFPRGFIAIHLSKMVLSVLSRSFLQRFCDVPGDK